MKTLVTILCVAFFPLHVRAQNASSNTSLPSSKAAPPSEIGPEFNSPIGWLRICQGPGKYVGAVQAATTKCGAGYWFKEPMHVSCACGHGVWVFAKGWCDHTARIIVAKGGSCFSINKDVRYIRHLGWGRTAYEPYHFVSTSGMEYLQIVPEVLTLSGMATHFHPEYNQHIGSIYRENGVEAMTGRFCLSPQGNTSRSLALKYFVPKLPYLQKKSCFSYPGQDLKQFEYDAGYKIGEGLTLVDKLTTPFVKPKPWATPLADRKCSRECPSPKAYNASGKRNNTLGPDYVDPFVDEYFLEELRAMDWKNTTVMPTMMPPQDCKEVRQYSLTNKTVLEIKEQTKRMIQANLLYSLQEIPARTVNYSDFNLMQKARKILSKVCPSEELPTAVLTGLHRMFRVALNESLFHYPYHQLGDDLETESIAQALETCYDTAKPMSFVYQNLTKGNSTNSTSPKPSVMKGIKGATLMKKCEGGKFIGVQYQFKGGVNRTVMSKLPCSLWSNITDLDLVIETAWKTVMFSHYYCARHFGNKSASFSVFEQKMEKFFNRWIQHRWFYPGPSQEAYKYIFQMFDLEKFAKALDRCVSAARAFSIYRKWIKRPVYVKYLGGTLFEGQYDIRDDIASRSSLDAMNPKPTEFNKKAFCLPYWHAPVSNPGINYNPATDYKPGCVKFRLEEWRDPFTPLLGKSTGWRDTYDLL